jgi:transcription elongation factor Elf1
MEKEEMKPCPFCGGKPETGGTYEVNNSGKDSSQALVSCGRCGATMYGTEYQIYYYGPHVDETFNLEGKAKDEQSRKESLQNAISKWNTRI